MRRTVFVQFEMEGVLFFICGQQCIAVLTSVYLVYLIVCKGVLVTLMMG